MHHVAAAQVLRIAFAVACLGLSAGPTWAQSPPAGVNSALVVDAVTLQPLAGATVFAQFDGLAASATTGADGIIAFPQFTADAATSDAEFMQREPLTLEASADGYLAIRKSARLTNVGRRVVLSLIPEDSGVVTPLIDAALGGRFQIPGVGVLNVDPGALAFDTRVRLIPIPDSSTSPEEVEGELAFEVWAASVDQGGQENSSLSSALGGVELTMAPRALPTPVAGAVRSWTVHRFDRFWTRTDSAPATGGGSAGATAPIAAGFNVLEHVPLAPDEDEGCEWSAWEVGLEPIGSSIPGAGATSASVNCGVYTAAVSVSVTSGTTSTTALSINVGVAGEILPGRLHREAHVQTHRPGTARASHLQEAAGPTTELDNGRALEIVRGASDTLPHAPAVALHRPTDVFGIELDLRPASPLETEAAGVQLLVYESRDPLDDRVVSSGGSDELAFRDHLSSADLDLLEGERLCRTGTTKHGDEIGVHDLGCTLHHRPDDSQATGLAPAPYPRAGSSSPSALSSLPRCFRNNSAGPC